MKVWVLEEVNEGYWTNYKIFREDHPPSSLRIMEVIQQWGYSLKYAGGVADHLEQQNKWDDTFEGVHISLKLVEIE
jgi:hypothetical protein